MTDTPGLSSIEGFVLVGGLSRRMGQDKASLLVNGQRLVDRAKDVLSEICGSNVRIANRMDPSKSGYDVVNDFQFLKVPTATRAALIGLHTALAAARSDWIAVLACDLPLITASIFRELCTLAAAAYDQAPAPLAAVPRQSDGRLQPLAAVYHRSCLEQVKEALTTDDWSLKSCLKRLSVTELEVPDMSLFNMNTEEDYKELSNYSDR
jgi:molybdopterin-guanine dinucleotide biosynthesis protein A